MHRFGNNRELGTKHEELGTLNMLCEDVCYLLRGWNILYDKITLKYFISDEMKIKFNMLGRAWKIGFTARTVALLLSHLTSGG